MKSPAKKVLIVEDEESLSEAYQIILKKEGYQVASASDGYQALEQADSFQPDLILLDLRMPRMGGLEFLQQYKHSGAHASTKVIIFSNLDTESDIEQAQALGAERYILKAWASPKELAKLVHDALAN